MIRRQGWLLVAAVVGIGIGFSPARGADETKKDQKPAEPIAKPTATTEPAASPTVKKPATTKKPGGTLAKLGLRRRRTPE